MGLTEALKQVLYEQGADLAGAGDMTGIGNCRYPVGVAVAVALPALPKKVVRDLKDGPTVEYYYLYDELNQKLNQIVLAGEAFLKEQGFQAYAQTTDRVKINDDYVSPVPHKTVAARAGLGWIGKNCLLVTPEYGPAVRISSLFTDAPLETEEPYTKSRCGKCLWEAGMTRNEIVDVKSCYEKQLEIMYERTGIRTDLCGKCFAVCRYTRTQD